MKEPSGQFNSFDLKQDHHTTRFLTSQQVAMIDEALCAIGDYGEIRLIVEKGKLRFLVTQRSYDALKWQPGSLQSFVE